MGANIRHKDSVFSHLFGNPDTLRELYSAIEGIDLPADIPININTIPSALFMGRINDVSFTRVVLKLQFQNNFLLKTHFCRALARKNARLVREPMWFPNKSTVDDRLVVLIEHQSSINHNMPLRLLMYVARVYEKLADRRKLYQRMLEKVPYPMFIVLYNGKEPFPDYKMLKLSDAFKETGTLRALNRDGPSLELVVHVYNINKGHNTGFAEKCKNLADYTVFVAKLREHGKTMSLDAAMEAAVRYCMENDVMRWFLEAQGAEVMNMLLEEWKIEEAQETWYEEGLEAGVGKGLEMGLEKGLEMGVEKGLVKTARNALAKGLPVELVCDITGLDMEAVAGLQAGIE